MEYDTDAIQSNTSSTSGPQGSTLSQQALGSPLLSSSGFDGGGMAGPASGISPDVGALAGPPSVTTVRATPGHNFGRGAMCMAIADIEVKLDGNPSKPLYVLLDKQQYGPFLKIRVMQSQYSLPCKKFVEFN